MWKCATRTLRATLGKRILRNSTVLTTKTTQGKDFNILVKFVPTLVERFNCRYGSYKNSCGNYSREKKEKKGPEENKNSHLGISDNNVFGVLGLEEELWGLPEMKAANKERFSKVPAVKVDEQGLGGMFMLAYFLLQPLERRRIFSSLDSFEKPPFVISGYQRTLQYVISSVGVKSYNSVLPEVQSASSIRCTSEKQFASSDDLKEERFTGLEKAHQKVMGTVTNWLGTQYMKTGKHREALQFFVQAAKEENPAGMFNLGICHEKGLGTSQNFKRAAELYQKAADLGHASAMYNLGVFYAQGRGEIEADVSHARELFRAAASLGQTDALKALKLENRTEEEELGKSFVDEPQKETSVNEFICGSILEYSGRDCESCGVEAKDCCEESTFDSDSGILDLSPENEADILFV